MKENLLHYVTVFLVLLGTFVVWPLTVGAGEIREFYRGDRAMAMGNAFTAVADDEQALFMNPAGLAGIKDTTFNYLAGDLSISKDIVMGYLDGAMGSLTGEGADLSDAIMGKNYSGRSQVTSTLVMPKLAVGIIVDGQTSLSAVNKALPKMTLGYQTTNGIQAGFGVPVAKMFRKKGELRVGMAAKVLWRRGGYHVLPTTTLLNMNLGKISQITGSFGRGLGVDFGTQYVHRVTKRLSLNGGVVYTDIGDTNFGSEPSPIKGNLAWGLSGEYVVGKMKALLAFDYRHVLEQADWRKKAHIGMELALPFLSLYGGVNQVYFTYGVAFDLWLFRITALSYGEEIGSFVHQNPEHRYALRFALKFNL